jgi:hypothetical protein
MTVKLMSYGVFLPNGIPVFMVLMYSHSKQFVTTVVILDYDLGAL